MNNINRGIVKSQAKVIMKNKVFALFVIILLVSILSGTSFVYSTNFNDSELKNLFGSSSNSSSGNNDNYFDNFNFENPIENFTPNSYNEFGSIRAVSSIQSLLDKLSDLGSSFSVVNFVFIPLNVTMAGLFVSLIRRNPMEEFKLGNEIGKLFRDSFSKGYGKKLLVEILRSLICIGLFLLFIIPGCIAFYSTYFTHEIMCEYPNLKPSEAIKLSKKMIKGNRTELFVLDLSFIGWYLLFPITLGFVGIYVLPYVRTTRALYYENFRLRALQCGRITEDDFLSAEEKTARFYANNGYAQQGYNQNPYQQPNANPSQGYTYNQGQSQQAGQYYYQPVQPQQPQQNGYYSSDTYNNNPYAQPQQAEPVAQPEPTVQTEYDTPAQPEDTYSSEDDNNL